MNARARDGVGWMGGSRRALYLRSEGRVSGGRVVEEEEEDMGRQGGRGKEVCMIHM